MSDVPVRRFPAGVHGPHFEKYRETFQQIDGRTRGGAGGVQSREAVIGRGDGKSRQAIGSDPNLPDSHDGCYRVLPARET